MKIYFVNGVECHTDSDHLTPSDILEKAGFSPEESYLVSNSGKEFHQSDEVISLRDGEKFEVKTVRGEFGGITIHYEVNGEQQTTNKNSLSLETILKNAGAGAGINPGEENMFRLENLSTDEKYNDLDKPVPLHDGDKFIAIYEGATPVA